MSGFIATNELRYVDRMGYPDIEEGENIPYTHVRVLQQKWVSHIYQDGIRFFDQEEWRDVPVIQEYI